MKWSKLDVTILILCLTSAALGGIFLYRAQTTDDIDMFSADSIAVVTPQGSDIRLKNRWRSTWLKINNLSKVQNKDRLYTGRSSEATVVFKTGENIQVAPNSLIIIQKDENLKNQISLESGSFFSDLKKEGSLVVKIGNKIAKIEGKNTVLRFDKTSTKKETQLTVVSGEAKIKTEDGLEELKSSDALVIDEGGEVIERKSYPVEIQSPKANAHIWKKQEENVRLHWAGAPKGRKVKVSLSTDPDFKNIVQEVTTSDEHVDFQNLPQKVVYWKVDSADPSSEKIESPVSSFSVLPLSPPILVEPRIDEEIQSENGKSSETTFVWKDVSLSKDFKLEVASDENFQNILQRLSTDTSSLQIGGLPPGNFFWRVIASNGERGQDLVSQTGKFSIKAAEPPTVAPKYASEVLPEEAFTPAQPPAAFKKPEPLKIEPKELRYEITDSETPVSFIDGFTPARQPILSWTPSADADEYRVQISPKEDFSEIVLDDVVSAPTIKWEDPYVGKFYARVMVISPEGLESDPSVIGKIRTIISRPQKKTIKTGTSRVVAEWSEHYLGEKYEVEIAKDPSFTQKVQSTITEEKSHTFENINPGQYYVRSRFLNKANWPASLYSKTEKVVIAEPPASIPEKKPAAPILAQESQPQQTQKPVAQKKPEPKRKPAQDGTVRYSPSQKRPTALEMARKKKTIRFELGGGGTYQSYSQSGELFSGKTESLGAGTWTGIAEYYFSPRLSLQFEKSSRPGSLSPGTSSQYNYQTLTQSYEMKYIFTPPDLSYQGKIRVGIQDHILPILDLNGTNLTIQDGHARFASMGAEYDFFQDGGLTYQIFMRYQYPLSATGSGGAWTISNPMVFDGSVGLSKYVSENWNVGFYWHGQYFRFNQTYNTDSGRQSSSDVNLLNSNVEVRLGYEYYFGLSLALYRARGRWTRRFRLWKQKRSNKNSPS